MGNEKAGQMRLILAQSVMLLTPARSVQECGLTNNGRYLPRVVQLASVQVSDGRRSRRGAACNHYVLRTVSHTRQPLPCCRVAHIRM